MDFHAIWILPTNCGDGEIPSLPRHARRAEYRDLRSPWRWRPGVLDDYATMEQRIYAVAMDARAEHEERVYQTWCRLHGDSADWIVLDGACGGQSTRDRTGKPFSRHYL